MPAKPFWYTAIVEVVASLGLVPPIAHQATITLIDDEIKALPDTEVVGAIAIPGAILIPTQAVIQFNGIAAYGDVGASAKWKIAIGAAIFDSHSASVDFFLTQTDPTTYQILSFPDLEGPSTTAPLVGQPILVSITGSDATPHLTLGDPANRLIVTTNYLAWDQSQAKFV